MKKNYTMSDQFFRFLNSVAMRMARELIKSNSLQEERNRIYTQLFNENLASAMDKISINVSVDEEKIANAVMDKYFDKGVISYG